MKGIFLRSVLCMLLFFLFIEVAHAASIEVNLASSTPFPAKPGDSVTLQFVLHNTGNEPLINVTTLLETEDDLFTTSPVLQTIPLIQVDEQKVITYQIGISGSASGSQNLKLIFGAQNLPPDSERFDLSVTTSKDVLIITQVASLPNTLAPGSDGQITLEIENTGDEKVKDVFVRLDLVGDIPFAPRASSTERMVESIRKQSSASFSFNIHVLPSAEVKIYKIPVKITYTDAFGKTFTKSDIVSLEILTEPHLEVSLDNSGFIVGRESKITLKAINAGLGDVKFLDIKLLPGDYEILSPDRVYIGNVDSDDFQTADFDLIFLEKRSLLNLEVKYRDEAHKEYLQLISLPVNVYSEERAKELGLIKTPYALVLGIGIALFLVLAIILRRILRKKRKKDL